MKTAKTSNDEILMVLKNSCGCKYYYNEIIICIIKNPCGQKRESLGENRNLNNQLCLALCWPAAIL